MRTLAIIVGILSLAAPAHAALDAEAKKPYQLQVVLQIGANRVFTPLFQEQLPRELTSELKLIFGVLARIEVTPTHPRLHDIETNGLNALEGWDAVSGRTTHFVQLDYVQGAYRIRTRFHEGLTGQAGPVASAIETHDRADIARTIARRIEDSFSPVGTVTDIGKTILKFKGGELGVPIDRWVRKGDVFAVSRMRDEGGKTKGRRVEWALLEAIETPSGGACRCKYWHRYQEDALRATPGTLGYRAIRLPTISGPLKLQLLDDATLAPLDRVRVRVQKPGDKKAIDLSTNRDGMATTNEAFDHFAIVQVVIDNAVRAQFPVELIAGRTAIARVKVATGGDALAPFETRRDAWLRRIYENSQMSAERARTLSAQLQESLEAARDAGKKSLPTLQEEIAYLADERKQLERLAGEKKWRFDPREGDAEIAELRRQAKSLDDFVQRLDDVLKNTQGEQSLGLVQLLERARLAEAEADFEQAIRLYDQVVQASPAEKTVKAHLDKLRAGWAIRAGEDQHQQARDFFYRTWPTLDAAALGKNMDQAKDAFAICRNAGDKLTPIRFLRANAAHTANLQKQLETLKRRDSEDNRNRYKALAAVGEALLRLHQDAAAWVGVAPPRP